MNKKWNEILLAKLIKVHIFFVKNIFILRNLFYRFVCASWISPWIWIKSKSKFYIDKEIDFFLESKISIVSFIDNREKYWYMDFKKFRTF